MVWLCIISKWVKGLGDFLGKAIRFFVARKMLVIVVCLGSLLRAYLCLTQFTGAHTVLILYEPASCRTQKEKLINFRWECKLVTLSLCTDLQVNRACIYLMADSYHSLALGQELYFMFHTVSHLIFTVLYKVSTIISFSYVKNLSLKTFISCLE